MFRPGLAKYSYDAAPCLLKLIEQIEYFFVSYNKIRGKKFKPLGRHGPRRAEKLIRIGMERFAKEQATE